MCSPSDSLFGPSDSRVLPYQSVHVARLSRDGRLALTACDDELQVWDVLSGARLASLPHPANVSSMALSEDDCTLLTGCKDAVGRIWDLKSNILKQTLVGHRRSIYSVSLSQRATRALTGSFFDTEAFVWDVSSGEKLLSIDVGTRTWCTMLCPSGQRALSSAGDASLQVWDLQGNTRDVLKGHTAQITCLDVSPDSDLALSGSDDGTVCVWDLKAMSQTFCLRGHTASVNSVTYSPARVASGSADKTVRVWDLGTGALLACCLANAQVTTVTFSGNGRMLLYNQHLVRVCQQDVERTLALCQGLHAMLGQHSALRVVPCSLLSVVCDYLF
jgi:WD40 repeat protein